MDNKKQIQKNAKAAKQIQKKYMNTIEELKDRQNVIIKEIIQNFEKKKIKEIKKNLN